MKQVKSSIGLSIVSVVGKILGFVKNILLSFFYGTSYISDIFNIMLTIPDTLFSLIANGINSSYIPIATSIEQEKERNRFTSEMISTITLLTCVISFLCMYFPDVLTSIFVPGFTSEAKELTQVLIRISIWSICFTGINNVLISYLQFKKRFISSGLTPVVLNIFQCIAIVLSFYYNSLFLAVGIISGNAVTFIILFLLAYNEGFVFDIKFNGLKYMRHVLLLSFPVMLGATANRINLVIDKAIASSISVGGISSLAYADSLLLFIKTVVSVPIVTIAFPIFSTHGKNKDYKSLTQSVSKTLLPLCVLLLPSMFGCIALSEKIVAIIFGRGAFNSDSVLITSSCLICYVSGLLGFCVRDLLVKIYYANFDTKTPTVNMIIGITLNILLNFVLSHYFGVAGLAMASSIVSYVIVVMLFFSLKKYLYYSEMKFVFLKIIYALIASIIMYFLIEFFVSLTIKTMGLFLSTLLSVIIGTITYIACILLFRVFELNELRNIFEK